MNKILLGVGLLPTFLIGAELASRDIDKKSLLDSHSSKAEPLPFTSHEEVKKAYTALDID